MPSVTLKLRLTAGVLGWILVKRCLTHLIAEIVGLPPVFRPVFGRLLIYIHSADRIFRQISTSSSEIMFEAHELVVRADM
jgi:hypothetical protein